MWISTSPSTLRLDLPLPGACSDLQDQGIISLGGTPLLAELLWFEIAEMAFLEKKGGCLVLVLSTSNQLLGLVLGLKKSPEHTGRAERIPHWGCPSSTSDTWWGWHRLGHLLCSQDVALGWIFCLCPAPAVAGVHSLAVLPSLGLLQLSGRLMRFVGLCYYLCYLSAWAGSTAGYTLRGFQNWASNQTQQIKPQHMQHIISVFMFAASSSGIRKPWRWVQ